MATEGHQHRERRTASARTISWLRPFFRYSNSRSAYILRVVGTRVGPVLVRERVTPTTIAPKVDKSDDRWRTALAPRETNEGAEPPTDA